MHMTGMRKFVLTTFVVMALTLVLVVLYLEDLTLTDPLDPEKEELDAPGSVSPTVSQATKDKPTTTSPGGGGGGGLTEMQMMGMPAGAFFTALPAWHRQANSRYIWKPTVLGGAAYCTALGLGGETLLTQ